MVGTAYYDTAQLSKIEQAKRSSEWFTAIVLSAVQLERHGYIEIKDYLQSFNVESQLIDEILEGMHLWKIAKCLKSIGKIDEKEYATIKTINKERNAFVHRKAKEKFKRGEEAKDKYVPLIDEAMQILKEKLNVIRLYVSRG